MQNAAKRYAAQLQRSRVALFSIMIPLVAAAGFFSSITPALRLIYIVLGFSLIIFLHELGHFVVARLCSVKCLAFSIGIGPRMCGWRKHGGFSFGADPYDPDTRKDKGHKSEATAVQSDLPTTAHVPPHPRNMGDTDYRISWLPLGGYVRMLGQDDMDPTKISDDPHSFNRRPIWQRMCIVSAGVIMNIIFAAVAFSIIFSPGIGVDFPPAVVGSVYYGMPAWGKLHLGDQVLSINDERPRGFVEQTDLKMVSALSNGHEDILLHVRPAGTHGEKDRDERITPRHNDLDNFLAIGVESIPGMKIAGDGSDYAASDYEKGARQFDLRFDNNKGEYARIAAGDKIVAVDDIPLPDVDWQQPTLTYPYVTFFSHLQEKNGQPVKITLENTKGKGRRDITIWPHLEFVAGERAFPGVMGLSPRVLVGEMDKSMASMPAAVAGIKAGDCITAVGERTYPPPEKIFDLIENSPGKPLQIIVERKADENRTASQTEAQGGAAMEVRTFTVTPKNQRGLGKIGVLLIQDLARTTFNSPEKTVEAGALNLPLNATMTSIDGVTVSNWQEIYAQLRTKPAGSKVNVTFNSGSREPVTAALTFSQDDYFAVHNLMQYMVGLHLELEMRTQVAANKGEAMLMGLDHTKKFILNVYMTLAGLFRGTVSPDNLHGIVGITKVGYDVQERGPVWLWYVLAMVSVNLAVANFLPLPIVDGGLFLLLILEKIRGKPLSLKVQTAIQAVGIVLLAGLFLFVTYNDIWMFVK